MMREGSGAWSRNVHGSPVWSIVFRSIRRSTSTAVAMSPTSSVSSHQGTGCLEAQDREPLRLIAGQVVNVGVVAGVEARVPPALPVRVAATELLSLQM